MAEVFSGIREVYRNIKGKLETIWSIQLRKIEFNCGVLSIGSALDILKDMRKNIRFEFYRACMEFINERHKYFETGMDRYIETVNNFQKGARGLEEKCIHETLQSFGISWEEFSLSLKVLENDQRIIEGISKLHKARKVVSEEIPENFSFVRVIVILKEYNDLLIENLEKTTLSHGKYLAIDAIWKKHEVNELDIVLGRKLFKNSLAVIEIGRQIDELEGKFVEML